MSRILVLGAAGSLGRHVARQASSAGHEVSALVRTASKLPADIAETAGVHEADLVEMSSSRLAALLGEKLVLALLLVALTAGDASAQQLQQLFQRTSTSVVVVRTVARTLAPDPGHGFVSAPGLGSGTIISSEGSVLTAAHVVQAADRVGVELQDGRQYMARVVASAPRADLALLEIQDPPSDLVPARLGDSDSLLVGDDVIVVGAPYGLSYTLSVGHVSGRLKRGETVSGVPLEFIQTDAHVNVGNSGGPMFNMRGEVVGVVSWILTQSGGFEGIGFAVTANAARQLLLETASFWTGVEGVLLTGPMARMLNVPQPAGLLIQRVAAGSPGARLGLQPGTVPIMMNDHGLILGGDIVLEIGGIPISDSPDLQDRAEQYLRSLRPETPVTARVLRGGQVVTLSATVSP